ncbi:MAG: hypothetical protein OHK0013_26050 [Sandaracinaceae bacterium]
MVHSSGRGFVKAWFWLACVASVGCGASPQPELDGGMHADAPPDPGDDAGMTDPADDAGMTDPADDAGMSDPADAGSMGPRAELRIEDWVAIEREGSDGARTGERVLAWTTTVDGRELIVFVARALEEGASWHVVGETRTDDGAPMPFDAPVTSGARIGDPTLPLLRVVERSASGGWTELRTSPIALADDWLDDGVGEIAHSTRDGERITLLAPMSASDTGGSLRDRVLLVWLTLRGAEVAVRAALVETPHDHEGGPGWSETWFAEGLVFGYANEGEEVVFHPLGPTLEPLPEERRTRIVAEDRYQPWDADETDDATRRFPFRRVAWLTPPGAARCVFLEATAAHDTLDGLHFEPGTLGALCPDWERREIRLQFRGPSPCGGSSACTVVPVSEERVLAVRSAPDGSTEVVESGVGMSPTVRHRLTDVPYADVTRRVLELEGVNVLIQLESTGLDPGTGRRPRLFTCDLADNCATLEERELPLEPGELVTDARVVSLCEGGRCEEWLVVEAVTPDCDGEAGVRCVGGVLVPRDGSGPAERITPVRAAHTIKTKNTGGPFRMSPTESWIVLEDGWLEDASGYRVGPRIRSEPIRKTGHVTLLR